ncbi:Mannose-1-phosphate guanylyltransferase [Aphelenchoides bicaudatus]|nr:Mannose-1-phosphate guanylyltransferase [Aphelenchoides bicaudatus]
MKALILVGGYGTRLRPLSLSQPKPLVDFANKPMVLHQLEALAAAGVDTIVLAVSYRAEMLEKEMSIQATRLGIQIKFSVEEQLGLLGAVRTFKKLEPQSLPGWLWLENICKAAIHSLFSILIYYCRHQINMALSYSTKGSGEIERFVEKPQEYVGNKINAGMYILNPSVLDRIKLEPTSIEKDVFPFMAENHELYAFILPGFWMDVGQPKDFLKGMKLYLNHVSKTPELSVQLAKGDNIVGPVLVDKTAKIGNGGLIGPNVVIGANVRLDDGVRIMDSTVLSDTVIQTHSYVRDSIIGWKCNIGKWVRIENCSVIGEDVVVKDELYLNGARVLPNKSIASNVPEPDIIM